MVVYSEEENTYKVTDQRIERRLGRWVYDLYEEEDRRVQYRHS